MNRKRKKVSVDKKLVEWAEEQIKRGKFKSFNQITETALEKLRESSG